MTTTTLPAAALVPAVKTDFGRRITFRGAGLTAHKECWAARTGDGRYEFEREDSPGTPWVVYGKPDGPDGRSVLLTARSSLRRCREYVTNGWADEALDLILAHERGEHESQRVPMCGWC